MGGRGFDSGKCGAASAFTQRKALKLSEGIIMVLPLSEKRNGSPYPHTSEIRSIIFSLVYSAISLEFISL